LDIGWLSWYRSNPSDKHMLDSILHYKEW